MGDLDPLGPTRGTRGVDQVGQVRGDASVQGAITLIVAMRSRAVVQADEPAAPSRAGPRVRLVSEQQGGL